MKKLIFILFLFSAFLIKAQERVISEDMLNKAAEFYQAANEAYDQKDFKKSAELFIESWKISENPYAAYNGACAFSLDGNKKKAFEYAQIAFENGMFGFEDDTDFDNVRKYKPFKKMVQKANAEKKALEGEMLATEVYVPESYSAINAAPLIVVLHGYGGNHINIVDLYKNLSDETGAVILSLRGNKVMGRDSFFWDESEDNLYTQLTLKINQFLEEYNIDEDKILMSGFSQGGWLCFDYGFKRADLFKGVLPVAGRFPEEVQKSENARNDFKVYAIYGLLEGEDFLNRYNTGIKQLYNQDIPFYLRKLNMGHTYPANNDQELMKAYEWLIR